jgi:O-antigen ligase
MKAVHNRTGPKNDKLLFWTAFFMAFPAFTFLGQQIASVLLLIFFYNKLGNFSGYSNIKIASIGLFFLFGSIVSVIDSNVEKDLDLSLKVLPNYIYWSTMLIFLPHYFSKINFYVIYKGITYGILSLVLANFLNEPLKSLLPFLRFPDNNGLAFMLIIFSPIVFFYLEQQRKIYFYGYTLVILIAMLLFERRAGFIIVATEFVLFILISRLNTRTVFTFLLVTFGIFISSQTEFFENFILSKSERIHAFMYENEESKLLDQSALTRKAMVEKGLIIFSEHPLTGIGLNNFIDYDVNVPLAFEGGEVLANKDLSNKSAHNSYIAILSGGGLLLFVPFMLLLLYIISKLSLNLKNLDDFQRPIILSFVGMIVHLFYISSIVNVFTWFFISIAATFTLGKRLNYKRV